MQEHVLIEEMDPKLSNRSFFLLRSKFLVQVHGEVAYKGETGDVTLPSLDEVVEEELGWSFVDEVVDVGLYVFEERG